MAEPRKRGARVRKVVVPDVDLSSSSLLGDVSQIAIEMSAPTEANIREIRQRIEEGFSALGTDALQGTVIPAGAKNNSREAADYVLADLLEKLAVKRKKQATEAADKAGVFGDPLTYVEGDTVMVFNDPNFSINVKMGSPTKMIGREEVEKAAEKYLGRKSQEFLEECFKPRSATKQIIVSMK